MDKLKSFENKFKIKFQIQTLCPLKTVLIMNHKMTRRIK